MGGLRQPGARTSRRALGAFPLTHCSAETGRLVAPAPPEDGERRAVFVEPLRPAVVLGSAQPVALADAGHAERAGFDIVRRRSGGGAVLVAPGAQLWLDVFVPASDPLFDHDVVASSRWLGELWRDVLRDAGVPAAALQVHAGGLVATASSRLVCFAGLGPGEVTLEGRKLVGCSQRRTRAGAWFHSMVLLEARQHELAELLVLEPSERAELGRAVRAGTTAVGLSAAELTERLSAALA